MTTTLYVCLGPIGADERCPELSDQRRCAKHRTRQARGLDAEYERNRELVLFRDRYRCSYCGEPATTADHVIPRNAGGPSTIDNLVAACQPCNRAKSDREGGLESLPAGRS